MNTQPLSERIAKAAAAGDFLSVQKLAAIARRLEEISERERGLAQEKATLEEQLNISERSASTMLSTFPSVPKSRNGSREAYSRGNMAVEITLPRVGMIHIAERTAAETMVVLMEHLLTSLGLSTLERLQQFRTGRGPLLSKRPHVDFKNSRRDEVYAHRRIPGTDLYVITHSSTLEKVARLKEALRFLGLPAGSYRIAKTD
jgi:hypothetical protein